MDPAAVLSLLLQAHTREAALALARVNAALNANEAPKDPAHGDEIESWRDSTSSAHPIPPEGRGC